MNLLSFSLFSLWWSPVLSLGILGINKISPDAAACVYIANNFTSYPFNCPQPDIDYKCRCRDPAFMGTVLMCIDYTADTPKEITNAYTYMMEFCKLQAHKNHKFVELAQIMSNSTKYAIRHYNKSLTLYNPVYPDEKSFNISSESVDNLLQNRVLSTIFGASLLGYWGAAMLVGLANNMGVWCVPSLRSVIAGPFGRWLQSHLVNPQLFSRNTNKKRVTWYGKLISKIVRTLPTRLESLVIFFYFVMIIVFCCVDYTLNYPNTIFKYRKCGLLVYIADRTGILAITQLPLLFLFAGRNNVFIFVTGWSYRTFNVFHKYISRLIWSLLVIHAICYVVYAKQNDDYSARWTLSKWRWANTAIISSAIMIALTIRVIRKMFYEIFKSCHQVLAIVFLIGSWNHCKTLGWMEFLYATLVIWVFDHSMRLSKIFISGGRVIAKCEAIMNYEISPQNHEELERIEKEEYKLEDIPLSPQKNNETYITESCEVLMGKPKDDPVTESRMTTDETEQLVHSIRITISHSGWWRDYPGCFVFVYFIKWDLFWQSHPFTLIESSSDSTVDQITMVVRVKDGLTRRLGEFLSKQPNKTANIPVLVEGPYGTPIAFRNFGNAIFVAAGIGITITYTLAMDLTRQYRADILRGEHNESEHNITLYWVTPNSKSIEANLPEVIALGSAPGVDFYVYVTKEDVERVVESDIENDDQRRTINQVLTNNYPGIETTLGRRPNIKREVFRKLEAQSGDTAVISCGPNSLNRDVRAGTGRWLKRGNHETGKKVEYFEEELLW